MGARAAAVAQGVIASCAMAVPLLCAAQPETASQGARPPAQSAAPGPLEAVRGLLERFFGPREPGDTSAPPAPAPPASRPDAPVPAAAEVAPPAKPAVEQPAQAGAAPFPGNTPAPPAAAGRAESTGASASNAPAAGEAAAAVAQPSLPQRSGIALILPIKSAPFGRAAEVARQGFMAARGVAGEKIEVRMFETDGTAEGAREALRLALASNPGVIVGPLTKAEVGGVVTQTLAVPILALNTPDGDARLPHNFFALSLNTESEARAAAFAAYSPDAGVAVVVTTVTPLSKRAALAFTEAWVKLGGSVRASVEFAGSLGRLKQAVERARGDVVFLASDAERAKLLRPYLGRNVMVIGTSQVFGGAPRAETHKAFDLNGLRFVDMPWLHQPDHAATMVFPRSDTPLSPDLERLYALGIDAFRIAGELARARTEFTIDGVTGALTVHAGVIDREPLLVEYRDGAVAPLLAR